MCHIFCHNILSLAWSLSYVRRWSLYGRSDSAELGLTDSGLEAGTIEGYLAEGSMAEGCLFEGSLAKGFIGYPYSGDPSGLRPRWPKALLSWLPLLWGSTWLKIILSEGTLGCLALGSTWLKTLLTAPTLGIHLAEGLFGRRHSWLPI